MLKIKNLNSFYIMAKKYSNEPKINHHSLWPKIGQHLRTLQTSFNLYNGYVCYTNSFIHSFIHLRPQGHMQLCNFKGLTFYLTKTPIGWCCDGAWPFIHSQRWMGSFCQYVQAPWHHMYLCGAIFIAATKTVTGFWFVVVIAMTVHIFVKDKWVS